jgi:hypothetical protein
VAGIAVISKVRPGIGGAVLGMRGQNCPYGSPWHLCMAHQTVVGNFDLSHVKGLNDVQHHGPSTIGIDTIYLSNGEIPEAFLRGAGVPDNFITFARSLVGHPIEFYSCFISYSSKDQGFAVRLQPL